MPINSLEAIISMYKNVGLRLAKGSNDVRSYISHPHVSISPAYLGAGLYDVLDHRCTGDGKERFGYFEGQRSKARAWRRRMLLPGHLALKPTLSYQRVALQLVSPPSCGRFW